MDLRVPPVEASSISSSTVRRAQPSCARCGCARDPPVVGPHVPGWLEAPQEEQRMHRRVGTVFPGLFPGHHIISALFSCAGTQLSSGQTFCILFPSHIHRFKFFILDTLQVSDQ